MLHLAAFTIGLPEFALWALILLALAELGGVFMNLGYQEKRKPLPKPVIYIHAVIAVIGFVLLIVAAAA